MEFSESCVGFWTRLVLEILAAPTATMPYVLVRVLAEIQSESFMSWKVGWSEQRGNGRLICGIYACGGQVSRTIGKDTGDRVNEERLVVVRTVWKDGKEGDYLRATTKSNVLVNNWI